MTARVVHRHDRSGDISSAGVRFGSLMTERALAANRQLGLVPPRPAPPCWPTQRCLRAAAEAELAPWCSASGGRTTASIFCRIFADRPSHCGSHVITYCNCSVFVALPRRLEPLFSQRTVYPSRPSSRRRRRRWRVPMPARVSRVIASQCEGRLLTMSNLSRPKAATRTTPSGGRRHTSCRCSATSRSRTSPAPAFDVGCLISPPPPPPLAFRVGWPISLGGKKTGRTSRVLDGARCPVSNTY